MENTMIEWTLKNSSRYAYLNNRCVGLVREYDTTHKWGATIKGFGENIYFASEQKAIKFIEDAFNLEENKE